MRWHLRTCTQPRSQNPRSQHLVSHRTVSLITSLPPVDGTYSTSTCNKTFFRALLIAMSCCAKCGAKAAHFHCGKCHGASYCCKECQTADWKKHRQSCQKQHPPAGAAPAMVCCKPSVIAGAGSGLFALTDIPAGTHIVRTREELGYVEEINDAVLPDWIAILSSAHPQTEREAAWQRYLKLSKKRANVGFGHESQRRGSLHYGSPTMALRDIAAGEEIYCSYGLAWMPMKQAEFSQAIRNMGANDVVTSDRIIYLIDTPSATICGVMVDARVLINTSNKPLSKLFQLSAADADEWMTDMSYRAIDGITDRTLTEAERQFLRMNVDINDVLVD